MIRVLRFSHVMTNVTIIEDPSLPFCRVILCPIFELAEGLSKHGDYLSFVCDMIFHTITNLHTLSFCLIGDFRVKLGKDISSTNGVYLGRNTIVEFL